MFGAAYTILMMSLLVSFLILNFEIISGFKKSFKNSIKNSCILFPHLHTASPYGSIFYDH